MSAYLRGAETAAWFAIQTAARGVTYLWPIINPFPAGSDDATAWHKGLAEEWDRRRFRYPSLKRGKSHAP